MAKNQSITSARRKFRDNWTTAFGTSGPISRSGTYVLRDGELVPIAKADRTKLRKADSVNIVSEATGIHPKQIPEFQKFFQEKGISGVKFDPQTGVCIYKDRQTKLRALKARQMFDRDEVRG